MANWVNSQYSASRVKSAGKRFKEGRPSDEDSAVLENWRAAHAYVLNTFQTNLRRRARNKHITVAQRLKRRPTIIDKLRREPTMQLNTMHDMAGCRLIFDSIDDLNRFRSSMLWSRFGHTCLSSKLEFYDPRTVRDYIVAKSRRIDRYNYIDRPKDSGYRGVHDVYRYRVDSESGRQWNGLHVEIQYRTIYQHAWATAVEVADLIQNTRIKFSDAGQAQRRFFQLTSEIIARSQEGMRGCCPELTNKDLVDEFLKVDSELELMAAFRHIRSSETNDVFKTNTILIFSLDPDGVGKRLEVETYDNVNKAIQRYEQLELELAGSADVVMVRADSEAMVRSAFRNYFSDTVDFVRYVDDGVIALRQLPELPEASEVIDPPDYL